MLAKNVGCVCLAAKLVAYVVQIVRNRLPAYADGLGCCGPRPHFPLLPGEMHTRRQQLSSRWRCRTGRRGTDTTVTTGATGTTGETGEQENLEPVTQREHDTFYLSKELWTELNKRYRRLSLDILEETGVALDDRQVGGQNQYFRPLALLLGERQIADMSPAEFRETIEQEDLIDDFPSEK